MFIFSAYGVCVEDFMVREVTFIPLEASYYDIFRLLKCTSFRAYPLVDSEGVYKEIGLFGI